MQGLTSRSGYNTNQALKVLPRIIPDPQQARVRFLVVFFGANDACLKGAVGSQHVPVDQYKRNLVDIVTHEAVKKQKPRIILVTPPPINEHVCEENDKLKGFREPRRKAEHTKLYADAARQVAKQQGIAILDLYALFMKHVGGDEGASSLEGSKQKPPNKFLQMLLHDGLHFTHVAYTLLFQELMRTIQTTWPDQMPDELKYVFPAWNDATAWPADENGGAS